MLLQSSAHFKIPVATRELPREVRRHFRNAEPLKRLLYSYIRRAPDAHLRASADA